VCAVKISAPANVINKVESQKIYMETTTVLLFEADSRQPFESLRYFYLETESITTNNFYKQKLRLKDDEPIYAF